jgi:hypothetical protein
MKKEIHRLSDEHQAEARAMVRRHRKKKKCNKCFDRGYTGLTEDNMIIPCTHCVDQSTVFDEWKAYVKARPELDAVFGKAIEEEEKAEAEAAASAGASKPEQVSKSPMPGANASVVRPPRE